jgi:hypothetical protein
VGGGFFVRYSVLAASLAWDAFEGKNGELRSLSSYRESADTVPPMKQLTGYRLQCPRRTVLSTSE